MSRRTHTHASKAMHRLGAAAVARTIRVLHVVANADGSTDWQFSAAVAAADFTPEWFRAVTYPNGYNALGSGIAQAAADRFHVTMGGNLGGDSMGGAWELISQPAKVVLAQSGGFDNFVSISSITDNGDDTVTVSFDSGGFGTITPAMLAGVSIDILGRGNLNAWHDNGGNVYTASNVGVTGPYSGQPYSINGAPWNFTPGMTGTVA